MPNPSIDYSNKLISLISGVHLYYYGCTKAYRKKIINCGKLYGGMHRFVPMYAIRIGARVTEIPVTHLSPSLREIEVWDREDRQSHPRHGCHQVSERLHGKAYASIRELRPDKFTFQMSERDTHASCSV